MPPAPTPATAALVLAGPSYVLRQYPSLHELSALYGTLGDVEQRDASLLAQIEQDVLDSSISISDVLRKCMILGGRAGSPKLREWASRELRGYDAEDELPPYRVVGAVLKINAVLGYTIVTGQQISPAQLPEKARKHINETVRLSQPIADIEKMAAETSNNSIHLTFSNSATVAAMMSADLDEFEQITAVYWDLSTSRLHAVIDQVRTAIAEFVAELIAELPPDRNLPSPKEAERALDVAIHGDSNRIVVQVPSGASSSTASTGDTQQATEPGTRLWRTLHKPGAIVVGAATILAAIVGTGQWAGWQWPW